MNLSITRFQVENIRAIRDLEVDLTGGTGNLSHVTMIQMPNGVGKSTTMELIRTVLQGKELDEDKVMSYQPNDFEASEGSFELDIEFSGNVSTLRLELDYNFGGHEYRTIKPQLTAGGDKPEHDLPLELENLMTESFIKRFVFDGELTDEFIGTDSDEAEEAIKAVNYLDRLDLQHQAIDDIVKENQEGGGAETEQGYKLISTEYEKAKKRVEELESKEERLDSEIDDLEDELKSLNESRKQLLEGHEDALERDKELQEKINRLEPKLESATHDLLADLRTPSKLSESFHEDLSKLYENMEILKLPKSTSQEFFRELAEGDECICGTTIDEELSSNILENSDQFLSEDDISVLNALKDRIGNLSQPEDFSIQIENIDEKREELFEARQEQHSLDVGDSDIQSKIDDLNSDIRDTEREIERNERKLKHLKTSDNAIQDNKNLTWKENLELCKNRRNEYKNKVQEATNTVNFGKKADLLDEILEEFSNRCLDDLKDKQIAETNKRLEQILGSKDVQIEDIDDSIILKNKDGASEGQKLSTAYAYLATLFEDSALDVPFFVDNPVVSIDFDKSTVVAHIIPQLFDQLVMFIIPRERDHFATEISSDDIEYLTIHESDRPGEVEKHNDREYFFSFQDKQDTEVEQEAA
jgi:ABC-type Mn2+/Zn2+ transport system ATPase subunit